MHRLTSLDYDVAGRRWLEPFAVRELAAGQTVDAGRESALPIAIDPLDSGVSRAAVSIGLGGAGWEIRLENANHGWLHPWAQRESWIERGSVVHRLWPRIGLLVVGRDASRLHWLLLETDQEPGNWAVAPPDTRRSDLPTGVTSAIQQGGKLTPLQLQAIQTVFGQHLAWPPVVSPEPMLMDAAARRLQVAPNAVSDRLKQARTRAYTLGPQRQIGVTAPDYVYVLSSAGYLPVPAPFGASTG